VRYDIQQSMFELQTLRGPAARGTMLFGNNKWATISANILSTDMEIIPRGHRVKRQA
jgi:hypothetical protein